MTTTGTALVAVKQALRDALVSRPGLIGIQISYGEPGAYVTGDVIYFGPAESLNAPQGWASGGRLPLEEIVTMTVNLQAFSLESESQETVDLRAARMLSELQQLVADQPQITPDVMTSHINSWIHHVEVAHAAASGYISRFEVQVQFRAVLR